MEEQRAIQKLKQGDMDGLETLVEKYYLSAVRSAYLVIQEEALAEDVVQSSFINLYQKIGQFDDGKPFGPWFYRSVVNKAISVCRKRNRLIFVDDDEAFEAWSQAIEIPAQNDHNLEEDYILKEKSRDIWFTLEKLSPQQRAAIVMRYYLQFSENEISEALAQPKSTTKWTLYAARKKLRQLLNPLDDRERETKVTKRNKR